MSTPAMAPEVTFYSDDGGVRVTNSRLIIGPVTYAMLNVTSVSRAFTKPSRVGPVVLFVIGAFTLLGSLTAQNLAAAMWGVLFVGLGVLISKLQKTKYHLCIASASGEAKAITSLDHERVDKIVQAVNEAMIKRG